MRYQVLSLIPVLRERVIYEQMRADGTLFLIPHPGTRLPDPEGWLVRWDLQLRHGPENDGPEDAAGDGASP